MNVRGRIITLFGTVVLATAALTGATTVASAAPAEAAGCKVSNLGWWSVHNVSCHKARHFNIVGNSTYKYAPWVAKGKTSSQGVCWANATKYGFQIR